MTDPVEWSAARAMRYSTPREWLAVHRWRLAVLRERVRRATPPRPDTSWAEVGV